MKVIKIPGIPLPQGRMRYSRRGFKLYDPDWKEKRAIREFLEDYREEESVFKHPHISFLFEMPIPKSAPKKIQEFDSLYPFRHEKKPDVDNLVKLYLDCLDGIVIHADSKVSLGTCAKIYSHTPCTRIYIQEMQETACFTDAPWQNVA